MKKYSYFKDRISEKEEASSSNSSKKISDQFQCVVANDEEFQLMMVASNLEALDFNVKLQAVNGLEVYEFLQDRKQPVDLVVLDLNMPIMNGFEACK